jgi:hypothetical protein
VDFEQAKARLSELMDESAGNLTAVIVEQDSELAGNREIVSAAAHALATEPDVITGEETDGREWFPYSFLIRSK